MGTPFAPSPCHSHGTPTTHTDAPCPTQAHAHSQPPIACMPIPHDERHAHACLPMGAYAYAHPPEMLSHPPEIAQNTAILNDYAESEIDRRACMILLCTNLHKLIILATPAEHL